MTWTKSQIQSARKIPLAPLLREKGFQLRDLPNGNFLIENFPMPLLIKEHYWFCKTRKLQGNTIDFFVFIQKMSFSETMQLLDPS